MLQWMWECRYLSNILFSSPLDICPGVKLLHHMVVLNACMCSHVLLFATPWTLACQAPLSMELSWQEYWCGFSIPPLGYLPNPGIEPASPALSGGFFTAEPVKNLPAMQELWQKPWILSLNWEDPLEKEMQSTSVFLPGRSHG